MRGLIVMEGGDSLGPGVCAAKIGLQGCSQLCSRGFVISVTH